MISVPGVGSGLDINNLVSQLVAAERDPVINSLGARQAGYNSDISALGKLKSALSTFNTTIAGLKNLSSFDTRKATSSDETVFTANATSSAVTGKYNIEVRNLATAQKLMTKGYTSEDSVVGTGTLTLTVDSTDINIDIDNDNNTLAGIRDAINTSAKSIGVSASIINVDDGMGGTESKLVLTSTNTGLDNAITVTVNDDDANDIDTSGLSALYYDTSDANPEQLTEIVAAEDADVRIDGQTVKSSSNTIANAIEGVTLTLLAEDIGVNKELSIEVDTSAVKSAITSFVGGYNTFINTINELNSFDADTGATGALFGDSTLRIAASTIRNNIIDKVDGLTGSVQTLVDIGITTNDTGLLSIDADTLDSAIESNLNDIANLFAKESTGIAVRLNDTLDSFIGFGGVIDNRTDGLRTRLGLLDDEYNRLERRMDSLQTRLLKQFSGLDSILSQLQSSSDFLTQQFSNIQGITKSKN